MNLLHKAFAGLLLASAAVCAAQAGAKAPATIRKVAVMGAGSNVEVEITGSQPLIPETQAVTGPDRLVLDFANAEPGTSLRNVAVSRGEMKAVRVGLFRANPPVTRVVLDLKSPQQYQLFPSGNTVIVKLGASRQAAVVPSQPAGGAIVGTVIGGTVTEAVAPPPPPPVKPAPKCEVEFRNGNLRIWADKATLAEVLFEVHKRTGADIPIPAGAEQEQVATSLGPGPARDVLAALLNGSKFNFIMVGSDRDPAQLRSVLLSLRGSPMPQATAIYTPPPAPVAQATPEPDIPQPQPDQIPPDQNEDQDNPDHR
jgi:AMIN domain-containing protein